MGANEVELDQLGIGTTRLNARLLIAALAGGANLPATGVRRGGRPPPSAAGGVGDGRRDPGQTTDAVAAAFAESVDADLLVYATSANGVYDADPNVDDDATQFGSMSPAELVDIVLPMSRNAGASAPVDLLAAKADRPRGHPLDRPRRDESRGCRRRRPPRRPHRHRRDSDWERGADLLDGVERRMSADDSPHILSEQARDTDGSAGDDDEGTTAGVPGSAPSGLTWSPTRSRRATRTSRS